MQALSIIWFILIAILWTMYFVLEGFDFGTGMLLPFAKGDKERSVLVRTIGPHWDGNEVWLLTAGGATFAAFPAWYATMFSGMYIALFLILVFLIVRITAIEWRSKISTLQWRRRWDWIQTISAYAVPLIFGVAFSNLVKGMHVIAQDRLTREIIPPEMVSTYSDSGILVYNMTGGFWALFTPYTILGGLMLTAVCFAHGTQFIAMKTEGELQARVETISSWAAPLATVLAAGWIFWGQGVYAGNALAWIPLGIAAIALIASSVFSQKAVRSEGWAFTFSTIGIGGAVAWIFSAMAPNVMKSDVAPEYSLTIPLASSTHPTLVIMIIVTGILLPIILAYTAWSYWVFRHRVTVNSVDHNPGLLPDKVRLGANFLTGKP